MIVKIFIFAVCTAVFLIIQIQSLLFSLEDLEACFKKNQLSPDMNLWNVPDEKARAVVECILGENGAVFAGRGRLLLNELLGALNSAANEYNAYKQNAEDKVRSVRSARSVTITSPIPNGRNCSKYDCYFLSDPIPNATQVVDAGYYESCFKRSNVSLGMELSTITGQQAEEVILCIQEKGGNVLTNREVLLFDGLVPILQKVGCQVKINTPGNDSTIIEKKCEPSTSGVRLARSTRKIVKRPRPRYVRCYFNAITCF